MASLTWYELHAGSVEERSVLSQEDQVEATPNVETTDSGRWTVTLGGAAYDDNGA
jgi:hypothetical protein